MYAGPTLLIILSLAPIAILLWYFDRLDKKQKEPKRVLWNIFLWGILATFAAGGIEFFLEENFIGFFEDPLIQALVIAFVFTATTEEVLKYLIVKKKIYDHPAFNEYYDGVIYAVVASLGFAALENLLYVFEGGIYIAVIRALLAVPAHALFGAIMGYYIGLAKFESNKQNSKKLLKKGLFLAIFLHGIYDFLLLTSSALALFVIPMILGMYLYVRRRIKYLHFLDKFKEVSMPTKWTIWSYLKVGIGMVFFTIGVLTIFVIALYVTQAPFGQDIFVGIDFSVEVASAFAIITWLIAFLLIRKSIQ